MTHTSHMSMTRAKLAFIIHANQLLQLQCEPVKPALNVPEFIFFCHLTLNVYIYFLKK